MSVKVLTDKVEVGNNALNESHKVVCYKCVQVVNRGQKKWSDDDIFLFMSDEYKNKGSPLLWDSTFYVYADMVIWDLYFVYIIYKS